MTKACFKKIAINGRVGTTLGACLVMLAVAVIAGCGRLWSTLNYTTTQTACQLARGALSGNWVGAPYSNLSQYLTLDGSGAISNGSALLANVGITSTGYGTGLTYVSGQVGSGTSFNGTTDYIDVPGTVGLVTANTTFSISLWFKLPVAGGAGVMVSKAGGTGGAVASGFGLTVILNGEIQASLRDNQGGGLQCLNTGTVSLNLNDGNWHHLVVVFTTDTVVNANNTAVMYVDGVVNQTGISHPSAFPYAEGTQDLAFGARVVPSAPQTFYNGALDDVAFWSTGLTSAQVQTLYACQLSQ